MRLEETLKFSGTTHGTTFLPTVDKTKTSRGIVEEFSMGCQRILQAAEWTGSARGWKDETGFYSIFTDSLKFFFFFSVLRSTAAIVAQLSQSDVNEAFSYVSNVNSQR